MKRTQGSLRQKALSLGIGLVIKDSESITDICFEVGYANISNFNRNFLRQYQMTPSSYRRLAKHRRPVR